MTPSVSDVQEQVHFTFQSRLKISRGKGLVKSPCLTFPVSWKKGLPFSSHSIAGFHVTLSYSEIKTNEIKVFLLYLVCIQMKKEESFV